jgi:hypothetical protein
VDPELIKKALEALEQGDDAAAMEILKGLIVSAASGEDPETDEPGAEGDGAEGVADPPTAESVIDPKVVPASETADDEDEDDPKKKMARRALRTMLCKLTGTTNFAAALVQVSDYRASHLTLETERQALAIERATLESAERRQLVVELVKLGAEFPSTIWADATSTKPSKLKPRWVKMSIAELRTHVADQRVARGAKKPAVARPGNVQPPAGEETETHGLTPMQLSICKEAGLKPEEFASLQAYRDNPNYITEVRAKTTAANEFVALAMGGGKKA